MKNGEFENLKHYSNIVYPILFIKKKYININYS